METLSPPTPENLQTRAEMERSRYSVREVVVGERCFIFRQLQV